MRVLVIDDDFDVVRLLEIKLTREGHEVETATDGTAAIEMEKSHKPELIVLETEVPGAHGLDIVRKVKKRKKSPLVVVLSHLDTDEAIEAAFDAGADDYLTKPFSPKVLSERIRIATIRRS